MKTLSYRYIATLFATFVITGCASGGTTTATVTSSGGPSIGQAIAEPYNGPKARIAVKRFTNKSKIGGRELGTGMADMLTTALFNSNRFIVLDRTDQKDIMEEQDLAVSGRVSPETGAPIGRMEGAELLVTASVTAFEPKYGGIMGGVGTAGHTGFLGLGGGKRKSYMAIDIKVTDARTGRIVAAATVEGVSSDWYAGIGGIAGGIPLGVGLGGYKNTPAEKAIRVVIVKAVEHITSMAPATYFHK